MTLLRDHKIRIRIGFACCKTKNLTNELDI